jgi:hypothetical protein
MVKMPAWVGVQANDHWPLPPAGFQVWPSSVETSTDPTAPPTSAAVPEMMTGWVTR